MQLPCTWGFEGAVSQMVAFTAGRNPTENAWTVLQGAFKLALIRDVNWVLTEKRVFRLRILGFSIYFKPLALREDQTDELCKQENGSSCREAPASSPCSLSWVLLLWDTAVSEGNWLLGWWPRVMTNSTRGMPLLSWGSVRCWGCQRLKAQPGTGLILVLLPGAVAERVAGFGWVGNGSVP